jgi:hypothetical protein
MIIAWIIIKRITMIAIISTSTSSIKTFLIDFCIAPRVSTIFKTPIPVPTFTTFGTSTTVARTLPGRIW